MPEYFTNSISYSHFDLIYCTTLKCVILGTTNLVESSLLLNHRFLTFKYYVYNARNNVNLVIGLLEMNIYKTKNIKKEISKNDPKKLQNIASNGVLVTIF